MRVESLRTELVPLWKRPQSAPMKTQAVCELGNGSHQMLNLPGPLSWTSQPPEVKYTLVVIKPPNLWYSVRAAQVDSALILVSWLSFMGVLRSSFPFSCPFWCRWTDVWKLRVSLTWQEKSGVRHVSQSSNLFSLHAHVYLYTCTPKTIQLYLNGWSLALENL